MPSRHPGIQGIFRLDGVRACGFRGIFRIYGGRACGFRDIFRLDGGRACGFRGIFRLDGGRVCGFRDVFRPGSLRFFGFLLRVGLRPSDADKLRQTCVLTDRRNQDRPLPPADQRANLLILLFGQPAQRVLVKNRQNFSDAPALPAPGKYSGRLRYLTVQILQLLQQHQFNIFQHIDLRETFSI